MDMDGDEGWHKITADQLRLVRGWMADIEGKTWEEAHSLHGPGCRQISLKNESVPEVRKILNRLEVLQRDASGGLYEFHIDGLRRFWGIRRGHVCYLIWWDPNHKIWPSTLQHT